MPSSNSFGLSPGASRIIACAAERGLLHDISQPLLAIRNYAHVLKMFPSANRMPEAQHNLIRCLEAEIDRVAEIVRGAGRTELQEVGRCVLAEALDDAVDLIANAGAPPVNISLPDAPVIVGGARAVIVQVLFSLLDRARVGGGGTCVRVTVEDEDAVVAMTSPGGHAPSGEGRGLGLILCQRIALVLGGSLAEEGTLESGRLWRLRLPLASEADGA